MILIHLLMVGIGGFFGAIARFSIIQIFNKESFRIPVGTLLINLSGAFLLGMLVGLDTDTIILLLLGTGFAGAFTTFSTLKFEMIKLQSHNRKKEFLIYTAATYGGGLFTAYIGYSLGTLFS